MSSIKALIKGRVVLEEVTKFGALHVLVYSMMTFIPTRKRMIETVQPAKMLVIKLIQEVGTPYLSRAKNISLCRISVWSAFYTHSKLKIIANNFFPKLQSYIYKHCSFIMTYVMLTTFITMMYIRICF